MSDRVAQTAVKLLIEPILEPLFHADSYGYRPGGQFKFLYMNGPFCARFLVYWQAG